MAPLPEPPTSIVLKVKVPPGHLQSSDGSGHTPDEFLLGAVSVTSTIGSIRQRIQQLVPSHPAAERQRLLYGGRALIDDTQTVADALNTRRDPTQHEYVVHLLVRGDGVSSSSLPAAVGSAVAHDRAEAGRSGVTQAQDATQLQSPTSAGQQGAPAHLHGQAQQQAQAMGGMPVAQPQQPGANPLMANANAPGIPTHLWHHILAHQQQQQRAVAAMQGPAATAGGSDNPTSMPDAGQSPWPPQDQPGPRRPISSQGFHFQGVGPNGQRVQIHQQVINGPLVGHPGFPNFPMLPAGNGPMPGAGRPAAPPQQPQSQQLSLDRRLTALERSRRDIVEIRTAIDHLRDAPGMTDEQRRHMEETQARVDRLSDYIDPFRLGVTHEGRRTSPTGASQPPVRQSTPNLPVRPEAGQAETMPALTGAQSALPAAHMAGPTPRDVTCYLLSSPQGPHAILLSPQHGTYTTSSVYQPTSSTQFARFASPRPTPTTQVPRQANGAHRPTPIEAAVHEQVQAAAAEQQAQVQAPAPAQAQDPLGRFQPLLGHLWLLLRILIFAYFLLGSNLGWQRPLILLAIGLGFWIIRMGLLADGAPLRRWWDGLVQVPRPAQPDAARDQPLLHPADQQQQPPAIDRPDDRQGSAPRRAAAAAPMPTPEQVAQRLLDEDAARRRQRRGWLREYIRPVERVLALFVASLWPGVGEAHVRAQEREERRLLEAQQEEESRRRAAEEEEAKKREAEANEKEGRDAIEAPSDASASAGGPATDQQSFHDHAVGEASASGE